MNPEEIDRLFRDELEKLEAAPGLEWNDDAAWKKIDTRLQGGWPNLLMGSIIAVAAVGLYMLYSTLFTKELPTPPKQDIVQAIVPLKTDTVEKIVVKEITPVKQKKQEVKKRSFPAKILDTVPALVVVPADTPVQDSIDTGRIKPDAEHKNFRYQHYQNRYRMYNSVIPQPVPTFFMPKYSVLRMDISNSYNFANLFKSLAAEQRAGENFYYIYEYNKNPSPVDMNRFPVAMPNNRRIITNFSR